MNITEKLLPSYCYSRHDMKYVSGIVIHYFSGKYQFADDPFNLDKCYQLFCDLNRPTEEREWFKMEDVPNRMYASAQYMIGREGEIIKLVPAKKKAYHAGTSEWNGRDDCNTWMIGVEMIATHDSGYTSDQYMALDKLTEQLIMNHGISWKNITGHENIAPDRKKDPGPLFDWERYRLLGNW